MVQKFPNADGYKKYNVQRHVYRNNKNHISKNQNGKHIHCFLIHLNFFNQKSKIKNTQIIGLISANNIEKMGNSSVLGGSGQSVLS
jgi:hypothetical protein